MISLRGLTTFGEVAAEDEPVLDYFLTTDTVRRIADNEVLIVLGRKGSGKTAIVRHFAESGDTASSRALNLGSYPWNVHQRRRDLGASEIEAYVESWRYLISVELAALALRQSGLKNSEPAKSLVKFLEQNYGGIDPEIGDILRPDKLTLQGLSFAPQVLGNALGSIALERSNTDHRLGRELGALADALINAVLEISRQTNLERLLLHFDELDRGLTQLDTPRAEMLTGLVLAARAIRAACSDAPITIAPVVYLRSDLWDELKFSDKNKIEQTAALTIEWNPSSLLALVEERIKAKLGEAASWDWVTDNRLMRGSQSKWHHIIARTFLRPRDVIAFLNATLVQARKRPVEPLIFINEDVTKARESYSPYLKKELEDEIPAHWPQWEEGLRACAAAQTLTFDKAEFVRHYEARRSSGNPRTADEALETLYSFSVIGYQRRSGYGGSSWAFHYTDPEAGWDPSATRLKVHLGLKEYAKLREERS
ncbi:MAG: hypothetical protein AB1941_11575 [Gemmatimonadota bacterium]